VGAGVVVLTRLAAVADAWAAPSRAPNVIGKWTGAPLRAFLERVGADTRDMDMATALHPQTIYKWFSGS